MKVDAQQQDFSGGMVDYLYPDRIPENAYYFGENFECRNGVLRTRRGQTVLDEGIETGELGPWTPVGSCRYVDATGEEYVAIALLGYVDQTLKTVMVSPLTGFNEEIAFPGGSVIKPMQLLGEDDAVMMFQYGRSLYMFRRSLGQVWKYDGSGTLAWTAVYTSAHGEDEWVPPATACCVAYGRVWLATLSEGDYGVYDCVTASDITMLAAGGLTWDTVAHNWQIGAEDHSDIMALVPHTGGKIIVFKRHSVHCLNGCEGYIDAVYCETLDPKHGAVGPGAAQRVGDDVWYLSDDGIRSVAADQSGNARAVEVPVSRSIGKFFSESVVMTSAQRFLCSAAVFDSYALFTVPYGQTVPNAVVAYDLIHGSWAGVWTHIYAQQMHVLSHGTERVLIGIGANGAVQRILTSDRWGQADAPTAHLITRAYNCGSTERRKSYRGGLLGLSSGGAVYTLAAVDFDTSTEKVIADHAEVESEGWMIFIPDDGIDIPDEGIALKDVDLERQKFFVGMQARALCLSLRVDSGALDLRALAIEASPGRAMSEF